MAKREVFQLKCGSGFEVRHRGDGQYVKRAERQTKKLSEDFQGPSSHSVRYLRYPPAIKLLYLALRNVSAKWEAIQHWKQALNHFQMLWGERIQTALNR